MIIDLKKIAVPLAVVVPLVTALAAFAGAVLVDRERLANLQADAVELSKRVEMLKDRHEEEHVQIELLRVDVKYIREGMDRIEARVAKEAPK